MHERLHPPQAEQLQDANPPGLAPVLAVGREADVHAAVGEPAGGVQSGPAGDGEVVAACEDLAQRFCGGHDDGRHGAEAEEDDGAVRGGEAAEGVVRVRAELVEVSNYGQLLWPGEGWIFFAEKGKEKGNGEQEKDQQQIR